MQGWKKKLSSRKFWAAVVGAVTALGALFGIDEMTAGQIAALISALSVLAVYILGESAADAAGAAKDASKSAEPEVK